MTWIFRSGYCSASKVRGRKAGMEELVALYDQMVEDRSAPVGISHASSPADALHIATRLRQVGCTGEIGWA